MKDGNSVIKMKYILIERNLGEYVEDRDFKAHISLKMLSSFFSFQVLLTVYFIYSLDPVLGIRVLMIIGLPMGLWTYSIYKYRFKLVEDGFGSIGLFRKEIYYYKDFISFTDLEATTFFGIPSQVIVGLKNDGSSEKIGMFYLTANDKEEVADIITKIYLKTIET